MSIAHCTVLHWSPGYPAEMVIAEYKSKGQVCSVSINAATTALWATGQGSNTHKVYGTDLFYAVPNNTILPKHYKMQWMYVV